MVPCQIWTTKVTGAIWKGTKSTTGKKIPKVEVGKMFLLGDLRLSFSFGEKNGFFLTRKSVGFNQHLALVPV